MKDSYSIPRLVAPDTVACSGNIYSYDSTFRLNDCQLASGQLAYDFRESTTVGVPDTRYISSEEQAEEVSIGGALGEVAFAVAQGVAFNPYTRKEADFVINGRAVDVKTSPIKGKRPGYPNLLINCCHYHDNTLYVAVQQLNARDFRVIGWIRAEELKDEWIKNPKNRGLCWIVPFSELHVMKRLIGEVIENPFL